MGEDIMQHGPKSNVFHAGTPRDIVNRSQNLDSKPEMVVSGGNATTVISSVAATPTTLPNNSNEIGNSSSSSSATGSPVNDDYGHRNYGKFLNILKFKHLNCKFYHFFFSSYLVRHVRI